MEEEDKKEKNKSTVKGISNQKSQEGKCINHKFVQPQPHVCHNHTHSAIKTYQ